jgi:hypothetical protein
MGCHSQPAPITLSGAGELKMVNCDRRAQLADPECASVNGDYHRTPPPKSSPSVERLGESARLGVALVAWAGRLQIARFPAPQRVVDGLAELSCRYSVRGRDRPRAFSDPGRLAGQHARWAGITAAVIWPCAVPELAQSL